MQDLSNRDIVTSVIPSTFAKILYQGDEGVIALAPTLASVSKICGVDSPGYRNAAQINELETISDDAPVVIFLPFTSDPDFSKKSIGHKSFCYGVIEEARPLVAAVMAVSKEMALFLLDHGSFVSEDIPDTAYADPEFCKRAVAAYSPRIAHVPSQNLTPELCVTALSECDPGHDIDEDVFPVAALARQDFARVVFATSYPVPVMDCLREAFSRHADVFAAAAAESNWPEFVPADLWEDNQVIKSAVDKKGLVL